MDKRRFDGLRERAPGLHRFLTSEERPYPVLREVAVGATLVLLVLGTLWGYTGQPLGHSPVVVVESGSMMHCTNGNPQYGRDCHPTRYGRLGTVDPGDLILVKDVDGRGDVATRAGKGEHHYGHAGDVIIYKPDCRGGTPIIHRALFWLEIHGDGTFSIPQLGLSRVSNLDQPEVQELGLLPGYADDLRHLRAGPEHSGFITRGDNNAFADQNDDAGAIALYPVSPDCILGTARGEVPWLGLVKLLANDLAAGSQDFRNAGGDSKVLLFITLVVLLGGPVAFEKVRARRRARRGAEQDESPPRDR